MFEQKRGLSAIVATLIVVLLAIVAFGIISNFILDEAKGKTESISKNLDCQKIQIKSASATNSSGPGNYNVTVERGANDVKVDGVRLLLTRSNPAASASGEIDQNIQSLGLVNTKVTFNNGTALDFTPQKLEVYPYIKKDSGERFTCKNPHISRDITN
ncbi:MAG: hypothetical protein ABEI74_00285 [Candidatus Pacearchaeota archaeon]